MKTERNFNWENLYKEKPIEQMGWYYPDLDPDLEKALSTKGITTGSFLDLGTGPGTQAVELAKIGFTVTGTDISNDAIDLAKQLSSNVNFVQDDILNSTLNAKFEFVFDRGCYHVFSEKQRSVYVQAIKQLLKEKGLLFLKCFSDKEPEQNKGPYRSSEATIRKVFEKDFIIQLITDTVYQGTREIFPKALFVIMQKR